KHNEINEGLMAEKMGFEPTIPFRVYSLSRGAPSTTRPPLRQGCIRQAGRRYQVLYDVAWAFEMFLVIGPVRGAHAGTRHGPGPWRPDPCAKIIGWRAGSDRRW